MRRTFVGLVVVAVLALASVGCGGSDEGTVTPSPATATPAATWTTVTTLRSTDPTNDMELHVSEQFSVNGDAQFVLDMPEGEETDGVIAAILRADEPITVEAGAKAQSVALAVGLPAQVVSGLDGSYVLLVTPSTAKAWSVKIQTQP